MESLQKSEELECSSKMKWKIEEYFKNGYSCAGELYTVSNISYDEHFIAKVAPKRSTPLSTEIKFYTKNGKNKKSK